jgi:hypothetical protein
MFGMHLALKLVKQLQISISVLLLSLQRQVFVRAHMFQTEIEALPLVTMLMLICKQRGYTPTEILQHPVVL